jgi:hypothetical protein
MGTTQADRHFSFAAPNSHAHVMDATSRAKHQPVWSGWLTVRIAASVPAHRRAMALGAIKGIHTAIFASVGAAIAVLVWEGLRGRAGRRSIGALAVTLGETAIYLSNNQVCPLTPVAEELGAANGTVADIFLPDWAGRRIPLVGGSALVLGIVLFARGKLSVTSRPSRVS